MEYIPHTDKEIKEMLQSIGEEKIDSLFSDIPKKVRLSENLNLPKALSEMELLDYFKQISDKNFNQQDYVSFCGAGIYDHFVPSVIDYIAGRSEFYTAYTPYQPEVSQGTLQSIYEYQSFICMLTGMEISNASLYDGASSVVEALMMAKRINNKSKAVISGTIHPDYIKTINTYTRAAGIKTEILEIDKEKFTLNKNCFDIIDEDTIAVVIQTPNFFGYIENVEEISQYAGKKGALFIACVDPISLGMFSDPSQYGADIVVGEGQSLGNYQSLGGDVFGFIASRKQWIRQMPGRIVGRTVDKDNKQAFTLTLQTREQHIRRQKATSNICSNQSLNILRAAVYCALMGSEGFKKIAKQCFNGSHYLAEEIDKLNGFQVLGSRMFFKEFTVKLPVSADTVNKKLLKNNIIGGINLEIFYPELKNHMLLCVTEKRKKSQIDKFINILKEIQ